MRTFLFPGQGAQFAGMGVDLFEEYAAFVKEADKILGYSLKDLCLNDNNSILSNTKYTQPALYMVNALSYQKEMSKGQQIPDFLIGNSIGEYNALLAAGVFSLEDGLLLVKKRSELMSRANGGGMAAVIGLNEKEIVTVIEQEQLNDLVEISNYNTSLQVVISGDSAAIATIKPRLEEAGARKVVILDVSGAFHSGYMKEAALEFEQYLNEFEFHTPQLTVISNRYARPYDFNNIKQLLVEQIYHPVRLYDSIMYVLGQGSNEFVEIGPGKTMTRMATEIKKEYESIKARPEKIVNCLGSEEFKKDYDVDFAYAVGGMCKGISSAAMIKKLADSRILGFLGTYKLQLHEAEELIDQALASMEHHRVGVNVTYDALNSKDHIGIMEYIIKRDIRNIEVSDYRMIDLSIVKYRLKAIYTDKDSTLVIPHKILAKVSSREMAEKFCSPAPEEMVQILYQNNEITEFEAKYAKYIPMCDDLCIEYHMQGQSALGYIQTIKEMSRLLYEKYDLYQCPRVGFAGGIGNPQMIAVSFLMGADFVVTGSINQCSVEAATSNIVKDNLQSLDETDFTYAAVSDLFEFGEKKSIVKKGSLYHIRANRLYEVYNRYNSVEEIPADIKNLIEEKYFQKSFETIYSDIYENLTKDNKKLSKEQPKYKMALIIRCFLDKCFQDALDGRMEGKINYQIISSNAIVQFNHWVKDTELSDWKRRYVDVIAKRIMTEGEQHLSTICKKYKFEA
ncbi:ACP S-malonyltransferase [Anaerocolumna xylanovorans]|nr:ACP S-malonyltransferase [Anaerocolumna xylanovorans]